MPNTTSVFRSAAVVGGLLGTVLLALPALGDVVVLRDGRRIEGQVRATGNGYVVTKDDGTEVPVKRDEVALVQVTGGSGTENATTGPTTAPSTAPAVDPRLASLRRSVANLDDVDIIISKYERFIDQTKGTETAAAAQADLEGWRKVQEQGLIRHAGEWIAPQERERRLQEEFLGISHIRLQVKQGELASARAALRDMLAGDPDNIGALYLSAIVDLREGEVARARTLLERVRASEPKHAPTLVNLAAISVQQNQLPRALTFLSEAMQAAPGNREVLDNVAEALALVPRDDTSRGTERLRQLFLSQDAALRQEMSSRGLYRWGSSWVPREQFEKLQQIEQEIEQKVTELQRQYIQLERDVAEIDTRMTENERFMQRLQSQRTYRDKDGRIFQAPLPPVYFETERDQQLLASERQRKLGEMQRLDQQAIAERQRYPVAPFKGELQVIGEDGVPVRRAPPSTRPGSGEPGE